MSVVSQWYTSNKFTFVSFDQVNDKWTLGAPMEIDTFFPEWYN